MHTDRTGLHEEADNNQGHGGRRNGRSGHAARDRAGAAPGAHSREGAGGAPSHRQELRRRPGV
ncbi:hypothetical protein [Halomonas sp.]|uniref:hypothetical protein n=1 Tax=Halomonas sp. TaxID=1486246 RepID=UPI002ACD297F|nr:hypothetical protein [Halomonas sp.]